VQERQTEEMKNLNVCKILSIFSLFSLNLFAIPDSYYEKNKEGYYFYGVDDEESNTSKRLKMPTIPKDLTAIHPKEFEKLLEEVKGIAVMNPTSENITTYMRLQNFATGQASKFEKAWKDVIIDKPELNAAINNPDSTYSRGVMDAEKVEARKNFYLKWSSRLGIAVFVKNDNDNRARKVRPLFDSIKAEYGLEYIFISTDDKPYVAAEKGVKTLPDVFLIYKSGNGEPIWHRVATGLVVKTDILDNIDHVVKRKLKLVGAE